MEDHLKYLAQHHQGLASDDLKKTYPVIQQLSVMEDFAQFLVLAEI